MQLSDKQKAYISDHVSLVGLAIKDSVDAGQLEVNGPGKEIAIVLPGEGSQPDAVIAVTFQLKRRD